MNKNPCILADCGWYDTYLGCCTCPYGEEWYQCPLEPETNWDEIMKENHNGQVT